MGKEQSAGSDKQASEKKRSIISSTGSEEAKEKTKEETQEVDSYTHSLEERIEFLEDKLNSTEKELSKFKDIVSKSENIRPSYADTRYDTNGDLQIFDGAVWTYAAKGYYNLSDYDMK